MMIKMIPLPILLAVFLTGGQLSVNAGELRPFVLPSTTQQQSAPARTYQRAQRPAPAVPAVYQKFADDVADMSQGQKNKLKARYRKLLTQAEKKGNQVEITYYNELLTILDRNQ